MALQVLIQPCRHLWHGLALPCKCPCNIASHCHAWPRRPSQYGPYNRAFIAWPCIGLQVAIWHGLTLPCMALQALVVRPSQYGPRSTANDMASQALIVRPMTWPCRPSYYGPHGRGRATILKRERPGQAGCSQ